MELAKLIGIFVASFPGVPLGPLHYRNLEELKSCGLKANKGYFDALISYTAQSKDDIIWWRDNIMNIRHSINLSEKSAPQITISTGEQESNAQ